MLPEPFLRYRQRVKKNVSFVGGAGRRRFFRSQRAPALITALKNYSGSILNCNYTVINDLGMSAVEGSYQFQSNLYINNVSAVGIYNFNNDIYPNSSPVFSRGNYTAAADAYLWTSAGEQASEDLMNPPGKKPSTHHNNHSLIPIP